MERLFVLRPNAFWPFVGAPAPLTRLRSAQVSQVEGAQPAQERLQGPPRWEIRGRGQVALAECSSSARTC